MKQKDKWAQTDCPGNLYYIKGWLAGFEYAKHLSAKLSDQAPPSHITEAILQIGEIDEPETKEINK